MHANMLRRARATHFAQSVIGSRSIPTTVKGVRPTLSGSAAGHGGDDHPSAPWFA